MKILFSPSEAKISGGDFKKLNIDSFKFNECNKSRLEILEKYNNYLKNSCIEELCNFFGLKDINECKKYKIDIFNEKTTKAIERYLGVAYKYLDYKSLNEKEKNFIDENVIIFSNLFGPLLAKDKIPNYKFKQGAKLKDLKIEKIYKESCSSILDKFLEDEDILDLRAGFYEKFYIPNKYYTKLKFIKNGKVVSHFAKAYRGIILRELAKNKIESIDEFMGLNIEKLSIVEIKKGKKFQEIVYEILTS
ncbi:YaaA family protein [Nitrosophilus kaiyonis]|uniref:YaaA family protein n=1 Tax=Nitrosophilus kaiyonis TaxID=2930200 RepID=UPI0024914022|nr:YaaA family protein [Nitrosophilus kaiyonis]